MYWHYPYPIALVFYRPLFIHCDYNQVLAVQFSGTFNYAVNFALQGSLMRDVETNLDERIDVTALSRDEVCLLVIARTIVEQRGLGVVASAQKFDENLIFQ